MKTFNNVFELDTSLKGLWHANYFKNDNPIVLELGCGRGEYTVGMAQMFPEKNFIGVDIKGSRIWRGAKTAFEEEMPNVAFLRCQIDHIMEYFGENEVSEIWITFPDPQPQESREKKRLTHPRFLAKYKEILPDGAFINLKTDSQELHAWTVEMLKEQGHKIEFFTDDLYASAMKDDPLLNIKTTYESRFLAEGKKITYVRFQMRDA